MPHQQQRENKMLNETGEDHTPKRKGLAIGMDKLGKASVDNRAAKHRFIDFCNIEHRLDGMPLEDLNGLLGTVNTTRVQSFGVYAKDAEKAKLRIMTAIHGRISKAEGDIEDYRFTDADLVERCEKSLHEYNKCCIMLALVRDGFDIDTAGNVADTLLSGKVPNIAIKGY